MEVLITFFCFCKVSMNFLVCVFKKFSVFPVVYQRLVRFIPRPMFSKCREEGVTKVLVELLDQFSLLILRVYVDLFTLASECFDLWECFISSSFAFVVCLEFQYKFFWLLASLSSNLFRPFRWNWISSFFRQRSKLKCFILFDEFFTDSGKLILKNHGLSFQLSRFCARAPPGAYFFPIWFSKRVTAMLLPVGAHRAARNL